MVWPSLWFWATMQLSEDLTGLAKKTMTNQIGTNNVTWTENKGAATHRDPIKLEVNLSFKVQCSLTVMKLFLVLSIVQEILLTAGWGFSGRVPDDFIFSTSMLNATICSGLLDVSPPLLIFSLLCSASIISFFFTELLLSLLISASISSARTEPITLFASFSDDMTSSSRGWTLTWDFWSMAARLWDSMLSSAKGVMGVNR